MPKLDEHQWMVIHLVTIIPVAAGFLMSLYAIHATFCRKKAVERAGENGVAQLTMRRAVRNEIVINLIHVKLLALSLWAVIVTTSPQGPGSDQDYYFAGYVGRSLVSCLLIFSSLMDMRDRKRIAAALDRQHPNTKSHVG